ncbi:rRNA maturation RNase YbeY [Candidatus Daviesbacteria bacterium]|nr:rRNA maturation RNase YbeY [Candidatus Daviesbacteria bacterium]
MISIIVNSDPRYPVNKLGIQATVLEILKQHRVHGNLEIGITVVGDRKMHEINKKFRDQDSSTNILSFAFEDPSTSSSLQHIPKVGFVKSPDKVLRLGDIMISYPQIIKDAALEGVSVEEELRFLVEHGTRHLLGVHHD